MQAETGCWNRDPTACFCMICARPSIPRRRSVCKKCKVIDHLFLLLSLFYFFTASSLQKALGLFIKGQELFCLPLSFCFKDRVQPNFQFSTLCVSDNFSQSSGFPHLRRYSCPPSTAHDAFLPEIVEHPLITKGNRLMAYHFYSIRASPVDGSFLLTQCVI